MGVDIDLDHLDPIAVGTQHRGEAVHDDLVVVDDRESNAHAPNCRRWGAPLVLTRRGVSPNPMSRDGPSCVYPRRCGSAMVILGLILLIIGLVASINILWIIGLILIIVGLVLNLVPVGGTRRRWY